MRPLRLPGHHDRHVDIDHCRPCGQVWFDSMESVQLSGLGWIHLLRELQIGATPDRPPAAEHQCPLCRTALREVRNLTRFGRFPARECPGCGGHQHSQAGMLAERGLVRPLLPAERRALKAEHRQLCCLNCGAPSDGRSDDCSYCATPLMMVDLPRLSEALRWRPSVVASSALPVTEGQLLSWGCRGCGAPLDPSRETHCSRCQHAVVVPSLLDLRSLLDTLEREWRDGLALRSQARVSRRASYAAPAPAIVPGRVEEDGDPVTRILTLLASKRDDDELLSPGMIVVLLMLALFSFSVWLG
jgi:hypothetical protein